MLEQLTPAKDAAMAFAGHLVKPPCTKEVLEPRVRIGTGQRMDVPADAAIAAIAGVTDDDLPERYEHPFPATVDIRQIDEEIAILPVELGKKGRAAHPKGDGSAKGHQHVQFVGRQRPQRFERNAFDLHAPTDNAKHSLAPSAGIVGPRAGRLPLAAPPCIIAA